MADQHFKTKRPTDKDLKENPGIGSSKGTTDGGELLEDNGGLDGDNTFEGDVGKRRHAAGRRRSEPDRTYQQVRETDMAGPKTHKQQIRIIEERVNTRNAGDDFQTEADLKRAELEEEERERLEEKGEDER